MGLWIPIANAMEHSVHRLDVNRRGRRAAGRNAWMTMLCCWSALAMGAPFNVRDFGAKGDGMAKDTQAIQAAIDKASAAGGTVVIPPGNYLSGTLHLRSNLSLHIEKARGWRSAPMMATSTPTKRCPTKFPRQPH